MSARNHHYVSQFYLKGFADLRDKTPQVKVFDLAQGRTFKTTPRNIAAKRDFNRVDIDGEEPDVIERHLSQFEGVASGAFGRIIDAQSISDQRDFDVLLNVLAMFLLRHPSFRKNMERAFSELFGKMTTLALANGGWDAASNGPNDGASVPGRLSAEELKLMFEAGLIKGGPTQEFLIEMELSQIPHAVELLRARRWSLTVAEEAEFVSSDRPANLVWTEDTFEPTPYPPGLALMGTTILFPISRRVMLMGSFEGPEDVYGANRSLVAAYNAVIARTAENQVFCRADFEVADRFGNIFQFSKSPFWEAAQTEARRGRNDADNAAL